MIEEHWPPCGAKAWHVTHTPREYAGLFRVTCSCPQQHPWIPQGGSEVMMRVPKPKPALRLTDEELLALAEFFNNDNYSMDNDLYDRIGRKLLIRAAKAGLYDEG